MGSVQYDIAKVAEILKGDLNSGAASFPISHLLFDSRKPVPVHGALFFALKGDQQNGHAYLHKMHEKGVRAFVVSQKIGSEELPESHIIKVPDTLKALQDLAAFHRRQFDLPIISITGSNGKTTVKEWLFQLLKDEAQIIRNPKSYNSQIGVPLSIWPLDASHELGIFEAGISMPSEMDRLERIVKPDIGIFTNIGFAHSESFSSDQHKAYEKVKLFQGVKALVYCRDHIEVQKAIENAGLDTRTELIHWSRKQDAFLRIKGQLHEGDGVRITAIYKGQEISIWLPFVDKASIENALHCWATLLHLGHSNEMIAGKMRELSRVAMRLETLDGMAGCTLINDAYNSDLGSLEIALDHLDHIEHHGKRTVILSDLLQSGIDSDQLYEQVAGLLDQRKVDRLIGIGPEISALKEIFSLDTTTFLDTESFLTSISAGTFDHETILIKGARKFGFERITTRLQQQAHETILEIDLSALQHNFNFYRSKLEPNVRIMVMVKAFGYGSGGVEIAKLLEYNNVDYLGVAYVDEGVQLRNDGIRTPIMVMNPEMASYDTLFRFDLEPEIYSTRTLEHFIHASETIGKGPFKLHLKIDTGMHRLGLKEEDIPEALALLKTAEHVKVASVFSHLAASEDPQHDDFTQEQIDLFSKYCDLIEKGVEKPLIRHIVNSSGISRFPKAHFDMVRLGIGLYGIGSNVEETSQLQATSSLSTKISQIKVVAPGTSVGYGRSFRSDTEKRIAILPIGYADGLSRILGNGGGKVLINGKRAPFVGNICMDMCMADVSEIECNEGDQAMIFGNGLSISELAEDLGTIPYEVLTSISRRVKRIYVQE